MSGDRLRELFDQHASTLMYGSGNEVEAIDWQDFEAAARALLAEAQPQPVEPVKPTDEQLLSLRSWSSHGHTFDSDLVAFAHAVLADWGRPAPEPVSVTERPWEREGWCDAEGRCWWGLADRPGEFPHWIYSPVRYAQAWGTYSVSLPHWALPVPQEQADG